MFARRSQSATTARKLYPRSLIATDAQIFAITDRGYDYGN